MKTLMNLLKYGDSEILVVQENKEQDYLIVIYFKINQK
jgi:hypothetical protein